MSEFKRALDPEVGVEVLTILAYHDGRPSEVVIASTESEDVAHRTMSPAGDRVLVSLTEQLLDPGMYLP